MFEDTPANLSNIVLCKKKLGVSHLYTGNDVDQALFEFQGQDNNIAGRIIDNFKNLTGRKQAFIDALASILTNNANDADALNAYMAIPFNSYLTDVPQMKLYRSFGHLALGTYAHYLFGHVQATAAISNDTSIINFMNGSGETAADIAPSLVTSIHGMNPTSAALIYNYYSTQWR